MKNVKMISEVNRRQQVDTSAAIPRTDTVTTGPIVRKQKQMVLSNW